MTQSCGLLFEGIMSKAYISFEGRLMVCSVSTEWTAANLQKLLAAMKNSITSRDRRYSYIRGLKSLDWNKVAFPPFSAEECQEKWTGILLKVGRNIT